jgi:hypothetical protein
MRVRVSLDFDILIESLIPCVLLRRSPKCQKFVKKLFAFFSKVKATKKPIVAFDRVYQKTSKALGVSYTSV